MTLQDQLINLPDDSIFAIAVRAGAEKDFYGTIQMIKDQYLDNPALVTKIIGEDLLKEIL